MSEAEDWAGALLESKGLEQLQDYLIRGRALSNVSTEELSSRWGCMVERLGRRR